MHVGWKQEEKGCFQQNETKQNKQNKSNQCFKIQIGVVVPRWRMAMCDPSPRPPWMPRIINLHSRGTLARSLNSDARWRHTVFIFPCTNDPCSESWIKLVFRAWVSVLSSTKRDSPARRLARRQVRLASGRRSTRACLQTVDSGRPAGECGPRYAPSENGKKR